MYADIGLFGRDETRHGGGVCGRNQFHLQPRIGKQAAFLGDHHRGMIGVHEPFEQHGQLVCRMRLHG